MNISDIFNPDKVKKWISDFINSLKKEDLENAIDTNLDLVKLLFNHYKLSEPHIKFIARPILKFWWNPIEEALVNPQIILDYIEREELKNILLTKKGANWLNAQCKNLYLSLYNYLWYGIDPVDTYNRCNK